MYVLFITMFIVSTHGDPVAVAINTTQFEDSYSCYVALETFSANVPSTSLNPTMAWCVPALAKQPPICTNSGCQPPIDPPPVIISDPPIGATTSPKGR